MKEEEYTEDFFKESQCDYSTAKEVVIIKETWLNKLIAYIKPIIELFEIKSKCMSANVVPNDLIFNHGNYKDYINRQQAGLDIILIIYSVNRKNKTIKIRHVFYAKNEDILHQKCLCVIKKEKSTLSQIIVNDYNDLYEIIPNQKFSYDFSENINLIISTARKLCMEA
jgi:hypothetical protein